MLASVPGVVVVVAAKSHRRLVVVHGPQDPGISSHFLRRILDSVTEVRIAAVHRAVEQQHVSKRRNNNLADGTVASIWLTYLHVRQPLLAFFEPRAPGRDFLDLLVILRRDAIVWIVDMMVK